MKMNVMILTRMLWSDDSGFGYSEWYDGYLVTIPNKEVSQEYINAISTMDWSEVTASIEASRQLEILG